MFELKDALLSADLKQSKSWFLLIMSKILTQLTLYSQLECIASAVSTI